MTDQEELEQYYKSLKKAIRTGAREAYYGDKRIVYRSLAEMQQILEGMEIELGTRKPGRGRTYADYNSGIHANGCNNKDRFNTD